MPSAPRRHEELARAAARTRAAYATWINPPEYQLYDLQTDRHEFVNRAEDPSLGQVKQRLMERLSLWQQETSDPLRSPEMLERLTQENDECRQRKVRSPAGGWSYLRYLQPASSEN